MSNAYFALESIVSENLLRIVIKGRIVFPEADTAESEILHLINENKKNIIFDFSSCEFIASSGYAMFIRIKKECEELGVKFAFANCSDTVKKGFFVIGYQNIIKFFDTTDDAKNFLS